MTIIRQQMDDETKVGIIVSWILIGALCAIMLFGVALMIYG